VVHIVAVTTVGEESHTNERRKDRQTETPPTNDELMKAHCEHLYLSFASARFGWLFDFRRLGFVAVG
jgi:hypothetical protein